MVESRALFLLALLAACGGGGDPVAPPGPPPPPPPPPPPSPVASVTVAPPTAILVPLQTAQLTATPKDAQGNPLAGRNIAWSSGTQAVATVDANGLVTAVAPGLATVSAGSEGQTGNAAITVKEGGFIGTAGGTVNAVGGSVAIVVPAGALAAGTPLTVTQVDNPPANPKLIAGTAWDLGPTGTAFTAPVTVRLKWTQAQAGPGTDPTLFRLHLLNGTVWEPVAGGTVDVGDRTVSGNVGHFSTYAIVETAPAVPVVGTVTVSAPNTLLTVGGTVQLGVLIKDTQGNVMTGKTVAWSNGGSAAATVSAGGLVTGTGIGQPTITATVDGVSGQIALTVIGTIAPGTVAMGFQHACALAQNGDAYCWGENGWGELGDGTQADRAVPTRVPGAGFKMISVGNRHTCGLSTGGQILCWGDNTHGQLGAGGSPSFRAAPAPVAGGFSFTWVSSNGETSCGVTTGHQLYCWGVRLGVTFDFSTLPSPITGGGSWTSISVGATSACGLDDQGQAWCFGKSVLGTSGLGTGSSQHPDARPVQTGLRFASIVTGNSNACGLQASGELDCWGYNGLGALGDGGSTEHASPLRSGGSLTYLSVATGGTEMCGAATDNRLYCWGNGPANTSGTGTLLSHNTPTLINGAPTLYALALGSAACGLGIAGNLVCWGSNADAQLARGYLNYSATPVQVQLAPTAQDVQLEAYPCALSTAGQLFCWGRNVTLGFEAATPAALAGALRFRAFGMGDSNLCGIASDAAQLTSCWGSNASGQIGDGTTTMSFAPKTVQGGLLFESITTGKASCARTAAGQLYCWGQGGSTTPQLTFPGVAYQSVRSGFNVVCGATTANVLTCWSGAGLNLVQPAGAPPATWGRGWEDSQGFEPQILCALAVGGQAYCAGRNGFGQLGDGSHNNRAALAAVSGGRTFTALAVSSDHICGIETGGDAYCWGSNTWGQLGVGDPASNEDDRPNPTLVQGGHKFQKIAVGLSDRATTCALTIAGAVYCWGENQYGALGIGRETASTPGAAQTAVAFRTFLP